MSDIDVVSVSFNGATVNADVAWTSDTVAQAFRNNIAIFIDVANTTDATPGIDVGDATAVTAADAEAMTTAMNNLIFLAENGLTHSVDQQDPLNTTKPQQTYYLTVDMLRDLELLIKSLRSAGWDGAGSPITEDIAELWRSMAPSFQGIINSLFESATIANRSIQSLVELEYVKTGNDVLSDQLEDLEGALKTTKDVLATLQELQVVHNNITVEGKGMFKFFTSFNWRQFLTPASLEMLTSAEIDAFSTLFSPFHGNIFGIPANSLAKSQIRIFVSIYGRAGSVFFGTPINPLVPTDLILDGNNLTTGLVGDLFKLRARLKDHLTELENTTPDEVKDDPNVRSESLLGKLETVLKDINSRFAVDGSTGALKSSTALEEAVTAWLLDNYDKRSDAAITEVGKIQQNITFAITAGQSLNDTQKEEVRRFMFLFEEFYKSASAILTKISQILEKIAQGMAR